MDRAIELARSGMNAGDGGPFGAVIVKNSEIIGEGWNQVLRTNDPTAHGEVMAIRDATGKLSHFALEGCDIYTTGQPCPMCLGAIYWARITSIFYGFGLGEAASIGFDDNEIFSQFSLPAEKRSIQQTQLSRDRALALIEEYANSPGHTPY